MVDEPAVMIAAVVAVGVIPVFAEAVSEFVIYAVGGRGGFRASVASSTFSGKPFTVKPFPFSLRC
jgi:hypothetical protein